MDRLRSLGVRLSNMLPLPPRFLPGHDRILGVVFKGTLTHARQPALRFTFVRCYSSLRASIPHGLTAYGTANSSCPFMRLLSLAVASDRLRKGLSPSIIQPCPTHLRLRLSLKNTGSLLTPILLLTLVQTRGDSRIVIVRDPNTDFGTRDCLITIDCNRAAVRPTNR